MANKELTIVNPDNFNVFQLVKQYSPDKLLKFLESNYWLHQQIAQLPEFTVEPKPGFAGNQEDPWGIREEDGITTISRPDGAFFSVQNQTITLHVGDKEIQWTQPLVIQTGETLSTTEGEQYITGFVLKVYGTQQGRTLIALDQEPGAPARTNANGKEIHPALRTPLQTSVSKMVQLIEGTLPVEDKFFQLAKALGLVDENNQFNPNNLGPATFSMDDANRVKASTLMGIVVVSPEQLQTAQKLLGENSKIITPLEESILATTGLFNGHLNTVSHLAEQILNFTNPELWVKIMIQRFPQAFLGLSTENH